MAESSFPSPTHNSRAVDDVEVEKWAIAAGGVSGVLGHPDDTPVVYADSSGRLVKIRLGKYAEVRGRVWYSGTTDITKSIAANSSGNPRIDRIVLRLDRSTYAVTVAVIQGTAAAVPAAPALTNQTGTTGVWELPLAQVLVANGATTLAANTVTTEHWYRADDGSVLCKSTTRPPLTLFSEGTRMTETNTGVSYAKVGSTWFAIGNGADSGWQTLAVNTGNGWTASVTQYRKIGGIVYLEFTALRSGGAFGADTAVTMATLPEGYRPQFTLRVPGLLGFDNPQPATCWITPPGLIQITNTPSGTASGRYVVLPPISYPAGG